MVFEFGGNGYLYSLNYDRRFHDRVMGRIGLMFFVSADVGGILAPLMLNCSCGAVPAGWSSVPVEYSAVSIPAKPGRTG